MKTKQLKSAVVLVGEGDDVKVIGPFQDSSDAYEMIGPRDADETWRVVFLSFISGRTWENNGIQFPRLIAELEAAGAFTNEVLDTLSESMDLHKDEICYLIDRAQREWDNIKENT